MLDTKSTAWQYLSKPQQELFSEGYYLVADIKQHVPLHPISDYSFLVFPFAKAYEGFLKKLFFDMGLIKQFEYESDHWRIGKALSPHLQKLLKKRSVYRKLVELTNSADLPELLWRTWKHGRNLVFHYFPHNLSKLSLAEAEALITEIEQAVVASVAALEKHQPVVTAIAQAK
ncbi:hypothetical protein C4579_03805 [Candidatus Microgenomates bacterium]|nr:MAG: hypothetical protein C4579_03805 [Candidatus Microgenomates bacterium]